MNMAACQASLRFHSFGVTLQANNAEGSLSEATTRRPSLWMSQRRAPSFNRPRRVEGTLYGIQRRKLVEVARTPELAGFQAPPKSLRGIRKQVVADVPPAWRTIRLRPPPRAETVAGRASTEAAQSAAADLPLPTNATEAVNLGLDLYKQGKVW